MWDGAGGQRLESKVDGVIVVQLREDVGGRCHEPGGLRGGEDGKAVVVEDGQRRERVVLGQSG